MSISPPLHADAAASTAKAHSPLRRIVTLVVKAAVTIAVLLYIVSRLGWEQILQSIATADMRWFGVAVALFALSGVLGAVQWRLLLGKRAVHLSLPRAVVLYFMGMFFNNFILGSAAADAVKIAYVKMRSGNGRAGFAATFLERFVGLLALLLFALVGSGFLLWQGLVTSRVLAAALVVLVVLFVFFVLILLVLCVEPLQRVVLGLLDKLPIPRKELVRGVLAETFIDARQGWVVVQLTGLAMVVQFLRVLVHVASGLALGLVSGANVVYFFVFVPILAIFMVIPMPFGIREGVGGALFTLVGFASEALVMGFLATIAGIVASSVGGVFFIVTNARTARR
jgi:uncharacterized membrane protein YbhN (UPF0104 family)